jgi:hypothetical protein
MHIHAWNINIIVFHHHHHHLLFLAKVCRHHLNVTLADGTLVGHHINLIQANHGSNQPVERE